MISPAGKNEMSEGKSGAEIQESNIGANKASQDHNNIEYRGDGIEIEQ